MRKLRNTLAAISILFLASCGGNKDYYMFTSFHEPANEGLRYLYSEDGMHWDSVPFDGTYSGRYLSFGLDHQLER